MILFYESAGGVPGLVAAVSEPMSPMGRDDVLDVPFTSPRSPGLPPRPPVPERREPGPWEAR